MTNDHKDKPQVKRYDMEITHVMWTDDDYETVAVECANGEWVEAADYDTLSAQLSEAQARLAEIERQEPVCVIEVKNGDGALIAGSLDRGTHKLYAAPVAPAAVKESLTTGAPPVADDVVRDALVDVRKFLSDFLKDEEYAHPAAGWINEIDALLAAQQKEEGKP